MNCCICYEEKEIQYECNTCQEGKICFDCFHRKAGYRSRIASWSRHEPEEVLLILSCPCCRTVNWKFLYKDILLEIETNNLFEVNHSYIKANREWFTNMEREFQHTHKWMLGLYDDRRFKRQLLKKLLKKELIKTVLR